MKQVLFHVDEMVKWNLAITNLNNLLDYYHKQSELIQIELVANSEAVKILLESDQLLGKLEKLAQKDVLIAFCNNALNAFSITKESVPDWITIVPAGVVEIAEKQFEGYAYIKP